MHPDARAGAARRLFEVVGHPCGLLSTNPGQFTDNRNGRFETLSLPLADNDGLVRFSIQLSQFVSDDNRPSSGFLDDMKAVHPAFLDIGFGLPDMSAEDIQF